MDSLLKHMVDMTGHRDHAMLDISVVAAIQELAAAMQTRVLSISTIGTRQYVHIRASIRTGGGARVEDLHDNSTPGELLDACPELAACLEIVREAPFPAATIHMVAGIVGVYRNFQNLLDYSERDSLTGLLNRKTFEDQLARILQCPAEPEAPLPGQLQRRANEGEEKGWLAVVDVDHFKMVNDTFGHLYGDEVLILIANQLQASFRAQDRVFRFGGEEFVVLLRSTTLEHARRIIDRFRGNVETCQFLQVGRVTVSVGAEFF